MAAGKHNFDAPIDLHQHELLNARLHALVTLPANPFEGQICYSSHPDIKLGALWNGTEWTFFGLTLDAIVKIYALPDEFINKHSELDLDDGTNPHGTTKGDVGLGNVDNTSDLNKPISNATQIALDSKVNISELADVALSGDYNDLENLPAETFQLPLTWTFSGSKVFNLPDGSPSESWVLVRVNQINIYGYQLPKDNIAYIPDPIAKTITLGSSWTPTVGDKIFMDLTFTLDN